MTKRLHPLRPSQAQAADPAGNAWTSASAGTGKTQVLTARVLRLLLDGAAPERILSLTFTRAAAAEMQARIFERLAAWVRADDAALDSDLAAIRAPIGPEARSRARQLFARTLEARGGLRVQTLHGFAQSLLASFPVEAGIAPGFAALDERSALALRQRVLAEAIEDAAAEGDGGFLDDIGQLSISSGEARLAQVATVLINHAEAIASYGNPATFEMRVRRLLGAPGEGSADDVIADAVAYINEIGLRRLASAFERDGGATATRRAADLLRWLGFVPAAKVTQLDLLLGVFLTKEGEPLAKPVPASALRADPGLAALAKRLTEAVLAVVDLRRALDTAAHAARHLRVGARLAAAYTRYKALAGVIDYGDMITRASALLRTTGMGDWVRFKLDQRIDHLLIDEAQDTNLAQWEIIGALTDEFYDGDAARDVQRTLFVVGDFKQAIMSFQGSDPRFFQDQKDHFKEKIQSAGKLWNAPSLSESFRSGPAVLEAVDAVLDELGFEALGLRDAVDRHGVARGSPVSSVTLWPPLDAYAAIGDDTIPGEMAWVPDSQLLMAQRVAQQIASWLKPETALFLPSHGRNVEPQDILVLVRARDDFMTPLVAALHDAKVKVAGVDRLRLMQPLAVQDLLALVRFALQPGDDLNVATLLTSPFLGWRHEQVRVIAQERGRATLWSRVQQAADPHAVAARDWLGAVLGLADFSTPYDFLETILSGPLGGRKRLLARLGDDARDAIGAVLGQALAFETANAPSLQGFLAWIEAEDLDLKRDPEGAHDAVRIMTVHGAKGLQAPVVILADATRDLPGDRDGHVMLGLDGGLPVPVFHGGKPGKIGRIATEVEARALEALQEHWRLMYVALTRAEDMLFIGGPLPKSRSEKPPEMPEQSWYALIDRALTNSFPLAEEADPVWENVRTHRAGTDPAAPEARHAVLQPDSTLPDWALTPAPAEARPPRPLSPSAIAADDIAAPPPGPAAQLAARRGALLHSLFERLPAVAPPRRAEVAANWLVRNAAELDGDTRAKIAATALAIIAAPHFAELFGPDALAEAPIAAVVGAQVIAGKVDRLLVRTDSVQLIDFKTGARVPTSADAVEPYHLRQMAAYVAALQIIFPGRRIEAALLFTHSATLIALPAELLVQHAPQLGGG